MMTPISTAEEVTIDRLQSVTCSHPSADWRPGDDIITSRSASSSTYHHRIVVDVLTLCCSIAAATAAVKSVDDRLADYFDAKQKEKCRAEILLNGQSGRQQGNCARRWSIINGAALPGGRQNGDQSSPSSAGRNLLTWWSVSFLSIRRSLAFSADKLTSIQWFGQHQVDEMVPLAASVVTVALVLSTLVAADHLPTCQPVSEPVPSSFTTVNQYTATNQSMLSEINKKKKLNKKTMEDVKIVVVTPLP